MDNSSDQTYIAELNCDICGHVWEDEFLKLQYPLKCPKCETDNEKPKTTKKRKTQTTKKPKSTKKRKTK